MWLSLWCSVQPLPPLVLLPPMPFPPSLPCAPLLPDPPPVLLPDLMPSPTNRTDHSLVFIPSALTSLVTYIRCSVWFGGLTLSTLSVIRHIVGDYKKSMYQCLSEAHSMSQTYMSTSDAPGMKVKKELGLYFQKPWH